MFPKHKINHENIVNMGTIVNNSKGMIKEALFVGCLDTKEPLLDTIRPKVVFSQI